MPESSTAWSPAIVTAVEPLTPNFSRVTLEGWSLRGYEPALPGEAFKLFLPAAGTGGFDPPQLGDDGLPFWPEGARRPELRTLAVRQADPAAGLISFDVALRRRFTRLQALRAGDELGLGGLRHGYRADPGADRHLLVGDRTALPAIAAIVEALPAGVPVTCVLEVDRPEERDLITPRAGLAVRWVSGLTSYGFGSPLEQAVCSLPWAGGRVQARVCAEAGVVRAVRQHLVTDRHLRLCDVQVVVQWQRGRTSDERDRAVMEGYRAAARGGRDLALPEVVEAIELAA